MAVSNASAKPKAKVKTKAKANPKASTLTLDTLVKKQPNPRSSSSLLTPPTLYSTSEPLSQQSNIDKTRSVSQSRELGHKNAAWTTPTPTRSLTPALSNAKGKGREVISLLDDGEETTPSLPPARDIDGCLWTELFQPSETGELAVHKRKVQDVRQWLSESFEGGVSGTLKKLRRILILSGPSGAGKSATIRALNRELEYDIIEWTMDTQEVWSPSVGNDYDSISEKFDLFLQRSAVYGSVLTSAPSYLYEPPVPPLSAAPSTSTQPPPPPTLISESNTSNKRRLILIEDLPNLSHPQTQTAFHEALARFVETKSAIGIPLVIIVSDEGRRAADVTTTGFSKGEGSVRIDIRSILPKSLLGGRYTTELRFNPIATTLMKKAMQSLLTRIETGAFGTQKAEKEMIEKIVQTANGDIRSAIMALEFICGGERAENVLKNKREKKTKKGKSERSLLELATQRENSLALFHLLGKVLYNKRKGDPSPASASAKEIQKEKEAELLMHDPSPLPSWFEHEERRTSKVDPEALYADSPIDTSLYSLYLHQNYPKFCDTEEQSHSLCDWLSYVDAMGGSSSDSYMWTAYINPYQFHLVTLGILHSLPSPVPRRGEKILKPSFFEWNSRKNEAAEAADAVAAWFDRCRLGIVDSYTGSTWGRKEIVCDIGAVLKAKWNAGDDSVPESFRHFAELQFVRNSGEVDGGVEVDSEMEEGPLPSSTVDAEPHKRSQFSEAAESQSWLVEDDIIESDE